MRHAAAAFNVVRRAFAYVEERTEMLAAIAHDLPDAAYAFAAAAGKVADETLRDKLRQPGRDARHDSKIWILR